MRWLDRRKKHKLGESIPAARISPEETFSGRRPNPCGPA